jgi:peptidoglycan/LPS O-acetylase OafA/YrhL
MHLTLNRDLRIDVLRAIAVIAVVLLHTQNAWFYGSGGDWPIGDRMHMRDTWLGIASIPVTFGFLGLNLFFLLSGLCIHLWWLKRSHGSATSFEFGEYFRRRLTRLYPAYFGAVIFSLLLLGATEWLRLNILGRDALSDYAANVIEKTLRFLTFTHTLKTETFGGYNVPLYTMAIEFHFYILYPLVLVGFRKLGHGGTLLAATAISVAASLWAVDTDDSRIMRLVLDSAVARWPEWILGCLMAEWLVRWRASGIAAPITARPFIWLAIFVFVAALLLQVKSGIAPNLLWTASLAPFVALFLQRDALPLTTLSSRLCWLGTISYSIYLIHWPILRIFTVFLTPQPESLGINLLIYLFLALPLTLALGYALFKLLEEPFLRSSGHSSAVRVTP